MMDLQTIQHLRSIRQRELRALSEHIAQHERQRTKIIEEIVDLVEAERRRTIVDGDMILPHVAPFGGEAGV